MMDIDKVLENLPLLLKNKDKILNNQRYSKCKVKGCGIYFKNNHIYVGFTLGDLLKLWNTPLSSWKYGKFYTYKLVLFGNGEGDLLSKSLDGSYQQYLIDSDLIIPHIEDAVRMAGMVLIPKRFDDIIKELKEKNV